VHVWKVRCGGGSEVLVAGLGGFWLVLGKMFKSMTRVIYY